MAKRDDILRAAETVWAKEGFGGPGIDRIIEAAHTTPRTLYRHFRSKEILVEAVLAARQARYRSLIKAATMHRGDEATDVILGVFDALHEWLSTENNHGCLFLHALSEYGPHDRDIAKAVNRYKVEVSRDLQTLVARVGLDPEGKLPSQLVLLIEGATASAPIMGVESACRQAKAVVKTLIDALRTTDDESPL